MPASRFFYAALAALAVLTAGAVRAETCFPDWSVAARIVEAEGLLTVEELTASVRQRLAGEVVKTTLCEENGAYVYRLLVRGGNGQLRTVTFAARGSGER